MRGLRHAYEAFAVEPNLARIRRVESAEQMEQRPPRSFLRELLTRLGLALLLIFLLAACAMAIVIAAGLIADLVLWPRDQLPAVAALPVSDFFTKDFLARHGIPTAEYRTFTEIAPAEAYIRAKGAPIQ